MGTTTLPKTNVDSGGGNLWTRHRMAKAKLWQSAWSQAKRDLIDLDHDGGKKELIFVMMGSIESVWK